MSTTAVEELLTHHAALRDKILASQQDHRQRFSAVASPPAALQTLVSLPLIPRTPPPPEEELETDALSPAKFSPLKSPPRSIRADLSPGKRLRAQRYAHYSPEEETIRNDYSQQYVDGGEWPANWVLGAEPEHRFDEYPKQKRLLALKKQAVEKAAQPPSFLPMSQLPSLAPFKFDSILIDPPISPSFTWNDLAALPIPSLAADPSFVFLWVGSGAGEGLERGRELLTKWGYRRCEDVVWIKTNKRSNDGPGTDAPTTSLFTRTKEHCLIGIRGTVRRSTDSWFVHCNIDTDVMIWEGDSANPGRKPPETYSLIENFCLGTRRLELFGRDYSLRSGWLTLVPDDVYETLKAPASEGTIREWTVDWWSEVLQAQTHPVSQVHSGGTSNARTIVPMSQEIDNLRPKSPVSRNANSNNNMGAPNSSYPRTNTNYNNQNRGNHFGGPRHHIPAHLQQQFTGGPMPNQPQFMSPQQQQQQQMMMMTNMGMAPGMGMPPMGMGPPPNMMGGPMMMNGMGMDPMQQMQMMEMQMGMGMNGMPMGMNGMPMDPVQMQMMMNGMGMDPMQMQMMQMQGMGIDPSGMGGMGGMHAGMPMGMGMGMSGPMSFPPQQLQPQPPFMPGLGPSPFQQMHPQHPQQQISRPSSNGPRNPNPSQQQRPQQNWTPHPSSTPSHPPPLRFTLNPQSAPYTPPSATAHPSQPLQSQPQTQPGGNVNMAMAPPMRFVGGDVNPFIPAASAAAAAQMNMNAGASSFTPLQQQQQQQQQPPQQFWNGQGPY